MIILQSNISEIAGQFLLYPIQPPVVSGETVPWVPPDTLIYNSDDIYPTDFIKIVNEGVMDGARLVTVVVHPIQYHLESQRLFIVTNINFEFIFSPNTIPEVRPHIRGEHEQTVYDAMLRQTVENDYEIPAYYQKPSLVEENQLGQLAPFPAGPAIIITDPMFADAFQPYADWLTDQGIRAHIISPAIIYAYFTGVDEAERIRNYIKYCYEHGGGTYFILGGMDSRFPWQPFPYEVPVRWCWCIDILPGNPPHYDTIPCDHYFCALDGNWNADGDETWGEMNDDVDQFPEVYVGRILCRDVQEVSNWVHKVLNYEKTPGNINALDTVKWIYQSSWFMGSAIDEFPGHFTHIIYTDPTAYEAFNFLNNKQGYTHAQTHGSLLGFFTNVETPPHEIYYYTESPPSPDYYRAGLNWLTNDNRYFIHYAVACNTGFFDDPNLPCVAESFTTRYRNSETLIPVGACASIEHTRYSLYPTSHTLQKEYYESLFTLEYPGASFSIIGFSLAEAKTQMSWVYGSHRWVCYATNLFGSPTTPAWTNVPGNLAVSHPSHIPANQQTQFNVTINDAVSHEPVAYAKVCLHKPGDIYAIKKTDDDGRATFFITPRTTGILKVTVTRFHNDGESYTQYLPSQTTCRVMNYPGGGQALDSENIAPDHLCIVQMPTFFKDGSLIKFGIPKESKICLAIYDVMGSRIKILKEVVLQAGYYTEKIETKKLSCGIYFIVLRQDDEKVSKKFLLIK